MVEPWLRGTLTEFDPVKRQVLHALQLTHEDVARWCSPLTHEQLEARPFGLPSPGFQMRHIVRSLDRLLTYAEGRPLDEQQRHALASEMTSSGSRDDLFAEFETGMVTAITRIERVSPLMYDEIRHVGRDRLPTTVAGLIIHCAEHTQRHTGQMVTTVKVVVAAG